MGFDLDRDGFEVCVKIIEGEVYFLTGLAMTEGAGRMESHAKLTAPWHDRTGNARRTLKGLCVTEPYSINAVIAGQMEYSPSLELLYQGRYSVLYPTVLKLSGEILGGVADLIRTRGGVVSGGRNIKADTQNT